MKDTKVDLSSQVNKVPDRYVPSPFWQELAAKGAAQLEEEGFDNFKRTVNMKYFNWGILGIVRHQLLPVLLYWISNINWVVFSAQFSGYSDKKNKHIKSFNIASAYLYKIYISMLWYFVSKIDTHRLLRKICEPEVGNPFIVLVDGCTVSQDLCNSVHEFYQSGSDTALDGREYNILEIGAGYGRLADVCLRALPQATYCIVDIPPALYLSQQYLSLLYPNEKIFCYREFVDFEEIQQEFEACRIRFLAAHQIELLPSKIFEQVLNISSLHEMTMPQIENYFTQIDRLCRGTFYTKQWRVSRAKVNGFIIREHEYPVPRSWKCRYHERHPIQKMFFEALYEIPSA
jgi:putative sugar O-methyltransferase